MQYNKMKLAVGIFVLIFFVAISAFSFFLLKEKGVFKQKFDYYFVTSSAQSFSVGMPLKFSGFDIGVIEDIKLRDDGKVLMKFSVTQENQKWISAGATLLMKKPLIGSPHIEIHSTVGAPPLRVGSVLPIKKSDDINDMIEKLDPVVAKIMVIIDNIETITSYLASEDSELLSILKNVDKYTQNLLDDDALLTTVTGDANATKSLVFALEDIHTMTTNMNKIVNEIGKITLEIQEGIITPSSSSAKELEMIMKDVHKKLQQLDGVVESVGSSDKELTQIKEQISVAIQKSNKIIDKVDRMMADEKPSTVQLP